MVDTPRTDAQIKADFADGGAPFNITPQKARNLWATVKARTPVACIFNSEFGTPAVGNNIADDTAAINAVIQGVHNSPAGGGEVFIPAGTFKITSGLALPSHIRLVGESKRISTLKRSGNFDLVTANGASTSSRIASIGMSNLCLDGSNGTGNLFRSIYGDHFNFDNLWFQDSANGATLIELFDSYFRACEWNVCGTLTNRTGASVLIQGTATDSANEIYFSQCRWEGFPGNALFMDSNGGNPPYDIWCSQCKYETAFVNGPSFIDSTSDVSNFRLTDSYLASDALAGGGSAVDGIIAIAGSWGWHVRNVHVWSSGNSVASVVRWNPTGVGNVLKNLVCQPNTAPTTALINFAGTGGQGRISDVKYSTGYVSPMYSGTLPSWLWWDDFGIRPTSAQGGNYTYGLGDGDNLIEMTSGSANTLTVPPNVFPIGATVYWVQIGAGTTTLTSGAGVTVNGASTGITSTRYTHNKLRQRALNTWINSAG